MKLSNFFMMSLQNIKNNRLRSILTMLGLIIGIASVIVLVGIGTGATNTVTSEVASLGADILTVTISSEDTLDYNDIDLMEELDNVSLVAPYKVISKTVSRESVSQSRVSIFATNDNYLRINNLSLMSGRNISIIDIENKSKICIIGSEVATSMFSFTSPVGEKIKLDGDDYTVVGVLEEVGTSNGVDLDNIVLIPLTTAKYLGSDSKVNNLYVKVENERMIARSANVVENYLRQNLQISSDDYSVSSMTSMIESITEINNTLSLLLGGIASISLVVGGIGVMNVMLVAVAERTKEIGIRKSLGAKKKDILIQFLIEALLLCIIGGIIGILLGGLIGNVVNSLGYNFTPSLSIIIISFSTSVLIGLLFGIFPAYRASCLNPIDALRTN